MGQITGGRVVFSRTIQPAQYESKKAEVELTFMVSEGESYELLFEQTLELVQRKALELLGMAKPAPQKQIDAVKAEVSEEPTEKPPRRTPRGPNKPKETEDAPIAKETREISDDELTTAVSRHSNATKNLVAIRRLRDLYVGNLSVRSLPQKDRAEFLEKLAQIGPLSGG